MLKRWRARTGLVMAVLFASLVMPAQAQQQSAMIGPRSPRPVVAVAPSPDWPADGTMLVLRGGEYDTRRLMRTRDGGQTWQDVAEPVPESRGPNNAVWVIQGPSGRVTLYREQHAMRGGAPVFTTLFRSTDDGDSWVQVWDSSTGFGTLRSSTIVFSPAFVTDGLVYHLIGGRLLRSVDAGATWQTVALAGEKGAEALAFSPIYATDRTILVSISALGTDYRPIGADTEAGFLLSTDGGGTWRPIPLPSHNGKPFPRVTQIVPSPTFAEDGTLFVEAHDGWEVLDRGATPLAAVFRSTDRGLTWGAVLPAVPANPGFMFAPRSFRLALSPSFAEDSTALVVRALPSDAEHRSGQCLVQLSTDAGTTWSEQQSLTPIEWCGTLAFWQGPDGMVAVGARSISYDLGETWHPIEPPDGAEVTDVRASPAFDQDGVLLVGLTRGGILALGPGAQAARGRESCNASPADALAQLYENVEWMWDQLGCATAPAQVARIFEKRSTTSSGRPVRIVWVPGVAASVYVLDASPRPNGASYWLIPLPAGPEPQAPDREVAVLRQGFENGKAWVFLDQDGHPTEAIFLGGPGFSGEYRAFEIPR
jgi:photosystem II stability/assembly factor-like uncharacterized protein